MARPSTTHDYVAPGGKVVYRHNGKVEEEELLTAILEVMTTGYQPTP